MKDPNLAYPNYKRLDVQRRALGPDGKWTEFADVDPDANFKVLDNLTEVDDELADKDALLEALVDPLPFPKAGYWTGVTVASLVPKEKLEVKKAAVPAGGYGGGSSNMSDSGSFNRAMADQMSRMAGAGSSSSSSSSMSMPMRGGSGMPGMAGMAGAATAGGPADETDFQKSELDEVMIRSIDFTVQPDTTYRYRVRLVVVNPNKYHSNVNPGVDTEHDELVSEWSEETEPVTVPADVAAYAMKKAVATRRDDQVTFQIVRWNDKDGQTITRTDEAGPGELIGQVLSAQVPSSEGKGAKSESIDFNSHRVVLDTMGGAAPAPRTFGVSAPFDEPTLTLILNPDNGTVAIHAQPKDVTDSVRAEMFKNYTRAIKESTKPRRPRRGGMMSMGGGMIGPALSPARRPDSPGGRPAEPRTGFGQAVSDCRRVRDRAGSPTGRPDPVRGRPRGAAIGAAGPLRPPRPGNRAESAETE